MIKIYLDNCCLNRPFDEQTQLRIQLESEAIKAVLNQCEQNYWQLILSQVSLFEIANTPDKSRRCELELIAENVQHIVIPDQYIHQRAKIFENAGLEGLDALHLACAEQHADILLTVDDKFLKKARKIHNMTLPIYNPLTWLSEVLTNEHKP